MSEEKPSLSTPAELAREELLNVVLACNSRWQAIIDHRPDQHTQGDSTLAQRLEAQVDRFRDN